MKQKKLLTGILLLFLGVGILQAQETVTAAGGEATGTGGSVSYTIGQPFYKTYNGTNGNSVAEGVQQPYEISVITETPEAADINLSVSAYPNPANKYIVVETKNFGTTDLNISVYDVSGKILQTAKVSGDKTRIEMTNRTSGTYFIRISNNGKEIKVFKVIKK